MPLQNRIDPWGQLNAESSRGAWMGNRGVLHNAKKEIVSQWKAKAWITCQVSYGGRQREVFSPNRYSELFFLDEATAFAAGHRPCAECRRQRYDEFKAAWCAVNSEGEPGKKKVLVSQIDAQMHAERASAGGGKAMFEAPIRELPEGAFIEKEGQAFLFWRSRLHRWTFNGYVDSMPTRKVDEPVMVLTPKSVVNLFAQGFQPQVHESAFN